MPRIPCGPPAEPPSPDVSTTVVVSIVRSSSRRGDTLRIEFPIRSAAAARSSATAGVSSPTYDLSTDSANFVAAGCSIAPSPWAPLIVFSFSAASLVLGPPFSLPINLSSVLTRSRLASSGVILLSASALSMAAMVRSRAPSTAACLASDDASLPKARAVSIALP